MIWKIDSEVSGEPNRYVVDENGRLIADCYADSQFDFSLPDPDEVKRNIALVVAAPELLAALEKCENVIGMAQLQGKLSNNALSPVSDALVAARNALDKTRV